MPSILAVTLLATSGISQSKGKEPKIQAKSSSLADYSNEPLVVERRNFVERFAADGTADFVSVVRARVQTDSAVRASGVLEFSYAARQDTLEIEYAKVLKPDGRIVETPVEDAQDLPMEVTRVAPFYSDLRVKQLPVKGLSVGDTIEYRVHRKIVHPAVPGEIWGQENFQRAGVVLADTLELRVPRTKYVKVVSKDVLPVTSEEGDEKVYRWKTSQLTPTAVKTAKENTEKNAEQPSVEWTSFHDWASVGAWYGGLQKDRVQATPQIKAKADELTRGAATDEDKIRALYTYVATQFRYIGVDFGIGRYQPHSANEVMDNQYGDCKDKHTLLAALLKAEGFTASPALTRPDLKLRMDVPSPTQFNHVITVVESGGQTLWMDSTTEVGPFRWLSPTIRGVKALVIPNAGDAAFATTPDAAPYPAKTTWETVGKLSKDGVYTGHFDLSVRDDYEVLMRAFYRNTARSEWDVATSKVLGIFGFAGTVTHANPSAPEDLSKPFHLSFDYERKDFGDWDNHRTYAMLPAWLFAVSKDDPKPVDPIYLGLPGVTQFKSVISVPDRFHPTLPAAVSAKAEFGDYSSSSTFSGSDLVTQRSFTVKQGKVNPAAWDEYLKWQKSVSDDEGNMVQLLGPGESGDSENASNPEAAELIRSAYNAIQAKDKQKAVHDLDEAKKLAPREKWLWAEYGYLEALDSHFDLALADFKKEIDANPEDVHGNLNLIYALQRSKRPDEALELGRALVKKSPDNVEAQTELATLLVASDKVGEGLPMLEKLAAAPNASEQVKLTLARTYVQKNRNSDAEPFLKGLISDSKNPTTLNDAAFYLGNSRLDLELAQSASQRAVDMKETQSTQAKLDSVTNDDLSTTLSLANFWDTLGWIYYRQGNLAAAEGYIKPAWFLGQTQVVGDHLAEIYEKRGKLKEARHTMDLAGMAVNKAPLTPEQVQFHEEMKRKAASAESIANAEELSKMRTVELPLRKKSQMSAEFFVLLSDQGIQGAKFISGSEELRSAEESLMKAKFNQPFPEGSKAVLVRRGILACSEVIGNCQFVMLLPKDAHAQ